MGREPFGFPPGFAPRDYSQRTPGRGQVTEHGPEPTLYVIDLASNPTLITRYVRPRVALAVWAATDWAAVPLLRQLKRKLRAEGATTLRLPLRLLADSERQFARRLTRARETRRFS